MEFTGAPLVLLPAAPQHQEHGIVLASSSLSDSGFPFHLMY